MTVEWHAGTGLVACSVDRVTLFDEEIARLRRRVCRDMTRAIVSLILATGFAVLVKRWRR